MPDLALPPPAAEPPGQSTGNSVGSKGLGDSLGGLPAVKLRGKQGASGSSRRSGSARSLNASEHARKPAHRVSVPKSGDRQGVSGDGAEKVTVKRKTCMFLCGRCSHDFDDICSDQLLRWAYSDGSGNYCWYCSRIFSVKVAHVVEDRDVYRATLATDKDEHTKFHNWRDCYVDRMKTGSKQGFERIGSGHTSSIYPLWEKQSPVRLRTQMLALILSHPFDFALHSLNHPQTPLPASPTFAPLPIPSHLPAGLPHRARPSHPDPTNHVLCCVRGWIGNLMPVDSLLLLFRWSQEDHSEEVLRVQDQADPA